MSWYTMYHRMSWYACMYVCISYVMLYCVACYSACDYDEFNGTDISVSSTLPHSLLSYTNAHTYIYIYVYNDNANNTNSSNSNDNNNSTITTTTTTTTTTKGLVLRTWRPRLRRGRQALL